MVNRWCAFRNDKVSIINKIPLIPLIKFDEDSTPSFDAAFTCRRVSYFDHFLSVAENCNYIYYELAKRSNTLASYYVTEDRLMYLWSFFAGQGKNFTIRSGRICELGDLEDTIKLGKEVMREIDGYSVCFDGAGVIWEPAYDLTHLLWLPKGASWTTVEKSVGASGLYLLD